MSCPKTPYLMQEYFADDLSGMADQELQRHFKQCVHCAEELESLLASRANLESWQEQSVPHWDRGMELFRREHKPAGNESGFWSRWQWFPTAASFAMLCLLLLNTTVVSSEQGFSVSFGGAGNVMELEQALADFAEQQDSQREALIARFEQRQDNNNVQLLEAVMQQTQQSTAENLERIYAYFEQQRLEDLQAMRAGYQELLDSDYQTIRSLQQLAQYVSYDDNLVPQ